MIKWLVAFAIIGIVIGVAGYETWQAEHPTPTVAQPTYPFNLQNVNGICTGTYDDNVSVSWPSINGNC